MGARDCRDVRFAQVMVGALAVFGSWGACRLYESSSPLCLNLSWWNLGATHSPPSNG